MLQVNKYGQIIILNGTPRSGKSSIAAVIQETFEGIWMNLGTDHFMKMTPERFQPGIGLRPGGERPDLEPFIVKLYQAMYGAIASHSRLGIHVVCDVGHHDAYSQPLGILPMCANILEGLPVLFAGVFCPVDVVMQRRIKTWQKGYDADGKVPPPVELWQEAVHIPGIYDIELDTSNHKPSECADIIRHHLKNGPPAAAFQMLQKV
ncbi:chloramphenicol phosphotransferase CPT family protein [Actinomycetes bacterium NPDC127524]